MVLQDIALFKNFLERQTLREIFIREYRKSVHFAKNPSSIEEFFMSVPAEDVIKQGIKLFSTNQTFGYDFFDNLNQKWLIELTQGRTRHSYNDNQKLERLEGMFRTLRENWDAVKSWLYEDVPVALARLGMTGTMPPEISPQESSEEASYKKPSPTDVKDFSDVPEADEELEFFDLSAGSSSRSNKLRSNECSLNFRSNSYKLTFNQDLSKKIKENDYKYVRLGKTKSGDIIIQLHKEEDNRMPVRITFCNTSSGGYSSCINSKDLCNKLKTLLNLSGDFFILHIEELSTNIEKANFKLSK